MKPKAGGRVYSAKQYQAVNMPETCVHTPAVHAGQTLFVPAESSMQRADTPEQPTQEDEAKARKRARGKAWRLANPAYYKEYYATDEAKARRKAYSRKAYTEEYKVTDEAKARKRAYDEEYRATDEAKSRRKQREQRQRCRVSMQHWQLFKQLPRPPLLPKLSSVLGRATTWTWRVAGRYMYRKRHVGADEFYRSLSAQNRIAMQKLHVSITPELLRRYTHLTKKEASIRLSLSTPAMAIICRSHGVMNKEWEKERRRYMKPKAPYRGDALVHTYRQSHTTYLPCVALGSCADRH